MLKIETHLTAVPALAADAVRVVPAYAGIAATQACSAPMTAAQGTAVPFAGSPATGLQVRTAGSIAGSTAVLGDADVTTPGSPPREAPV